MQRSECTSKLRSTVDWTPRPSLSRKCHVSFRDLPGNLFRGVCDEVTVGPVVKKDLPAHNIWMRKWFATSIKYLHLLRPDLPCRLPSEY